MRTPALTIALLLAGCAGPEAERRHHDAAAQVAEAIKPAAMVFDPVYECADGWSFWMYEKDGARVVTLVDRTATDRILRPSCLGRFADERTVVDLSAGAPEEVTLTADGRPATPCRRAN